MWQDALRAGKVVMRMNKAGMRKLLTETIIEVSVASVFDDLRVADAPL